MRLIAIIIVTLALVQSTLAANATVTDSLACGFITSGIITSFRNTDSQTLCGYLLFRDYAMVIIWGLQVLWLTCSAVYYCAYAQDLAPKRSALIQKLLAPITRCCCGEKLSLLLIEVILFLFMGFVALIFPEITILLFIFMLMWTMWDNDEAGQTLADENDPTKPLVQPDAASQQSRFDSIRPRIQFPAIKYKQVPTNVV